jgi:hypothetical protein
LDVHVPHLNEKIFIKVTHKFINWMITDPVVQYVTSLNLCECESEGFQKLELKLDDNETNKDAFFSSPLKS